MHVTKQPIYALAKAVEWDAQVILSVPCCQHELESSDPKRNCSSLVMRYGILKESNGKL